jgi:tetratricopeptide (TPR) repeat protein
MRPLAWASLLLLLMHLVAAGVFGGWLWSSGRVDADRLEAIVDMFRLTIEEEAAQREEAARLELEARALADRAARLEEIADGPRTLRDRLAREERADDLAIHRLERLQRETGDLRRQIERAKEMLAEQKRELDAEREAFDAFVAQTTQRMQDEDFQQAVAMYQQLRPRQAKEMFQQLLEQGREDRVVDILASMQLRRAANVLREFKTPPEIEQATMLIQKLAERGVYPVDGVAEAAGR